MSINSINQLSNNINISSCNSIYTKQELSPEDSWGPPTFVNDRVPPYTPELLDEQLLSPIDNTAKSSPFNAGVEAMSPDNQLFDTNVESQTMCLADYDTPPLTFEDDIQKVAQVYDEQYKGIVQSYKEHKPLPATVLVVAADTDATTQLDDEDNDVVDTAAVMSSQGPVMNTSSLHVFSQEEAPKVESQSQEMLYKTSFVFNKLEHNYTLNVESRHDEVTVKSNQLANNTTTLEQRRVPKLKLKIPKQVKALQSYDEVSTPQITNEILAMESDFDLISYITSVSINLFLSTLVLTQLLLRKTL